MIRRHPEVPDYFLVLEPQRSFGEYARVYGDRLARHYEDNGVIVVPSIPIPLDLEYFQQLAFPLELQKAIGTVNGIERSIFVRDGDRFAVHQNHPLVQLLGDVARATYAQRQIVTFNARLRHGLSVLFPRYLSLEEANITWRLSETIEEGMHFDVFAQGAPLPESQRSLHRLKIFINIDATERRWRTSLPLPGVLERCRSALPDELPDDINVVCDVIDRFRLLGALPCHDLAYPTLSAVIANGETVAHEVVYGRRVVAAEFFCRSADMLDPDKLSHACLARWLREAGYTVGRDARAISERYAHLQRSAELVRAARAGMAGA